MRSRSSLPTFRPAACVPDASTSWGGRRSEYLEALGEFLASGERCAVAEFDGPASSAQAAQALRNAARREGLAVTVNQRRSSVYLSRAD